METIPRQKLKELIALYGPASYDDPARCKELLLEICGAYQFEVQLLITALEEGIVAELWQTPRTIPYQELLTKLVKHLQNKRGFAEHFALWAVNSWALALGIIQAGPDGSSTLYDNPTEGVVYNESVQTEPARNRGFSPGENAVNDVPRPGSFPSPVYPTPSTYSIEPVYPAAPSMYPGAASAYTPIPPPPPYVQDAKTRRWSGSVLGIVGIVALLVVASVIGVFVYTSRSASESTLASTPTPIFTPTPTPVAYPALVSAYSGSVRNTTGNLNAIVSLTSVIQSQGNVNGDITVGLPLTGSGLFTGTVSSGGAVHFVDTSNDGSNVTITLTGSIAGGGSMSGTYSVSNGQGGSWRVTTNPTPIVYPILFAKYSGQYYNTMTSKSGAISLSLKSQNQENISGSFLLSNSTYPLNGSVGTDNSIQFAITPSDGSSIKFSGSVNLDGSLGGTYTASAGGNGTWKVTPG